MAILTNLNLRLILRGHAWCFHNSVWSVLVTDATEQLPPGLQGIVFVFGNCCYVKWYSLNICLKTLVGKMFKISGLPG